MGIVAVVPGAVRLNTATVTQYLSSQSSLTAPLVAATDAQRKVVLLRSVPHWEETVEPVWDEDRTARIVAAPSPLAVHELVLDHLTGRTSGPCVLVVLTDREQSELDPAILARVHKQRIETVDGWEVVREAFGAEQVDPRLKDANWAAEALLDATPPGGWPRLAGGPLSRQHALTELALRRLRIGRYDTDQGAPPHSDVRLDARVLLQWTLTAGGPERLLGLRGPERAGLTAFLGEEDQAGLAGRVLLTLVDAEHGADAAAFGLVCGALWEHAGPEAETYRARGRAERWFGEQPPAVGEQLDVLVSAFGRTVEEYVATLLAAGERVRNGDADQARQARRITGVVLDRAGALSRQFGAESAAAASPVMAAGFEARFATVGKTLAAGDTVASVRAVGDLDAHLLAVAGEEHARVERARMGLRLARWLATDPATLSETVAAGMDRHVTETGWVDLALEHIEAGGDPDPVLKAAYDALGARVRERRRAIDREFAGALAVWTAAGTPPGSMLTVETFLDRVVRPAVWNGSRRLLLLVLDGMSAAIASELGEELRQSWAEFDPLPDGLPHRRALAAALPTVTAVSRTSLFAGTLMKGAQADEKQLFPRHQLWGGAPAAVFHKDDLRAETAGDAFGRALSEALNDGKTHVAVVLNTIDDRLAKEQKLGDGAWRVDEVGKLRDLLRVAAEQGMMVVLTSDHGHVVDRHGMKIDAAEPASARHRLPGAAVLDTEIALSGPRVVWPEPGSSIVALWDADSRYTAHKAGYHGGASTAEFTIPILAFLRFGAEPPKGWRELGDQRPEWWSLESADNPAQVQHAATVPPARRVEAKPTRTQDQLARTHESLFDTESLDAAASPAGVSGGTPGASSHERLVAALLATENYQAQAGLLARKPRPEQVEKALVVLLEAGGTLPASALAQRIGLLGARADGFAAILRQLLNFDGEQVLETLPDGRTLRLNSALLREQFGLG